MARVTAEGGREGSSKTLWIWLGVLVLLVVLVGVALEVTARPAFCGTCHEMKPAVDSWAQGSHAKQATCLDCHADPGLVGYFKAHVVDGLRDVYWHVTKRPNSITVPVDINQGRCLRCHGEGFGTAEKNFPPDHPPKTAECWDCHGGQIHPGVVEDRSEQ